MARAANVTRRLLPLMSATVTNLPLDPLPTGQTGPTDNLDHEEGRQRQ